MAEDAEMPIGQPFTTSKRRKIFRKRGLDDSNQSISANSAIKESTSVPRPSSDDEEAQTTSLLRARKPAARKYGIGFSSFSQPHAHGRDAGDDRSLMPIAADEKEDMVQVNRFVKPTGRAGQAEDKHLTAYIDSKLAEMRSMQSASTTTGSDKLPEPLQDATDDEMAMSLDENDALASTVHQSTATIARQPQSRNLKKSSRRKPKVRDPTSLARDDLIDQILSESQVPIYDSRAPNTGSAVVDQQTGEGQDNDEAAVQAFKAEFVANLRRNNRRRPPKNQAGGAKNVPQKTSNGPKLGGSRSQREKMRAATAAAAEEAKTGKSAGI